MDGTPYRVAKPIRAGGMGEVYEVDHTRTGTPLHGEIHRQELALETWRLWNLSTMLTELISERDAAMCAADVICALTIQRCIAPGSKLQAQRWFPRTALPELLGVAPALFHNTGIHSIRTTSPIAWRCWMRVVLKRGHKSLRSRRCFLPADDLGKGDEVPEAKSVRREKMEARGMDWKRNRCADSSCDEQGRAFDDEV